MKFLIEDDELKEVPAVPDSNDKGLVIEDQTGKRGNQINPLQKELAANDALVMGASIASQIHGIPQSSASKWKDGKDLDNHSEVKSRVLARKYGIQDIATMKLMETLDLIDPSELVRTKDKVAVIGTLGSLVDKMSDGNNNINSNQVHLHMYMPNQKKVNDYDIIEA